MPTPPVLADVAEERTYLKNRLAAAFRVLARFGLNEGVAGHVTVRDPEFADRLWVNPYGHHFAAITATDLVCIDVDGNAVDGSGPVNQAAYAIHAGVHEALPTVRAVAHSHTPYGKAFCALRAELLPITQEHCIFFEDHVRYDGNVVITDIDEGRRIGRELGGRRSALLTNHGLLTVGDSVESCLWRFLALERCCQVQLVAQAAGPVTMLAEAEARAIHAAISTEYACWFAIRSLFERELATEPAGLSGIGD